MLKSERKSWDYQKGNYKQINIKFNMNNEYDAMLHHFIVTCKDNVSALIKKLLYEEMAGRDYEG